jgi:hypothetical protein
MTIHVSITGLVVFTLLASSVALAAENKPTLLRGADGKPDGRPDLQGIWTSGTLTPYERPDNLADKSHVDPAVTAAQQKQASERFLAAGHRPGDVGRDNDAFIDHHLQLLSDGQTSLVVFPLNGKYPIRPEAEKARDFNLNSADTFETMSQWDRCITREPTAMFPVIYNNAYQIVQTASHVVVHAEMVHDARVIAMSGSHPDSRVRSWGGDSRGRWDGDTLVVDTTNFNSGGWMATGQNAGRLRGVPYSKDLHIIERFTPIDKHILRYEITIDDPQSFTSALKLSYPLERDNEYRMYEYACHEGNAATEMILRGARVQEAEAAKK